MPNTEHTTELIKIATSALELKQQHRSYLRRAAIHQLHIKQVGATERDLQRVLAPMFQKQIASMVSKLLKVQNKDVNVLTKSISPSKLSARIFDKKKATEELIDITLPILAVRMIEAANNQLRQLGIKNRRKHVDDLQNKQTKTTTATDWLEEQGDLTDLLEGLPEFIPGSTPYRLMTELPPAMRASIVKKLQESFNQDYWANISDTTQGDAERILEQGLQEGWSIRDMANTMRESLGGTQYARRRSFNIARTESGGALNGARRAVMDQVQEDLGVEVPMRPTWLSVLGNTTRDSHANLDGVPANNKGMWDLSGYMIPYPAHYSLPPGERCFCQCSLTLEFGMRSGEATQLIQDYYNRLQETSLRELQLKYDPSQPRDDHGRFTTGGGSGSSDGGGSNDSGSSNSFDFGDGIPVAAHRHTNLDGSEGGWVADTATVQPTAIIGKNAKISGNAEIGGFAVVSGDAKVYGDAWVFDNAKVTGDAVVSGNAKVTGDAVVSGNAKVSGNAIVTGYAEVSGNAKVSGDAVVSGDAKVYGYAKVYGNAHVFDKAKVFDNAKVSGDAKVYGNAEVSGYAEVSGNAKVTGYAEVSGNAKVYGDALVSGNAEITGDAEVTGTGRSSHNLAGLGAAKLNAYRSSLFPESTNTVKERHQKIKAKIADDLGKRMSEAGIDATKEVLDTFGGPRRSGTSTLNSQAAAAFVDTWAATSGDHTPTALAIQARAKQTFKLKDSADPTKVYNSNSELTNQVKEISQTHGKVIDGYLKACYDGTQETLKKLGIDEIIVYRGTGKHHDVDNKVKLNPLSSFSTNPGVAKSFGNAVIKMKVPRKKIFSTSVTGAGCYDEDEVIVLGGVYNCERIAE